MPFHKKRVPIALWFTNQAKEKKKSCFFFLLLFYCRTSHSSIQWDFKSWWQITHLLCRMTVARWCVSPLWGQCIRATQPTVAWAHKWHQIYCTFTRRTGQHHITLWHFNRTASQIRNLRQTRRCRHLLSPRTACEEKIYSFSPFFLPQTAFHFYLIFPLRFCRSRKAIKKNQYANQPLFLRVNEKKNPQGRSGLTCKWIQFKV